MVVEKRPRETKAPGGIALRPSMWAAVDAIAASEGRSRNQVLEALVTIGLSRVLQSQKSEVFTQGNGK